MAGNFLSEILNKLLFENKIKATELAREICIPQPTLHRMLVGKSPNPHRSTLEPIAKYFNITIEQLKGEIPFSVAEKTNASDIVDIPLISWDKISNLKLYLEKNEQSEKYISVSSQSKNCFATHMNDSSMEPLFSKNCILIFDLDKKPTDRSYVLVKFHESNNFLFRQVLIDGTDKFLKPIHPELYAAKLKVVGEQDVIIATLIEARQFYE